jgi:hypothetical protein
MLLKVHDEHALNAFRRSAHRYSVAASSVSIMVWLGSPIKWGRGYLFSPMVIATCHRGFLLRGGGNRCFFFNSLGYFT